MPKCVYLWHLGSVFSGELTMLYRLFVQSVYRSLIGVLNLTVLEWAGVVMMLPMMLKDKVNGLTVTCYSILTI